jgi:hypothetical protein
MYEPLIGPNDEFAQELVGQGVKVVTLKLSIATAFEIVF